MKSLLFLSVRMVHAQPRPLFTRSESAERFAEGSVLIPNDGKRITIRGSDATMRTILK
jgi:hypothetical protein